MSKGIVMHRMATCNEPTAVGQIVNAVTYCGLKRSYNSGTHFDKAMYGDYPEDATWGNNKTNKPISCPVCISLGDAEDARIKIIVDALAKGDREPYLNSINRK